MPVSTVSRTVRAEATTAADRGMPTMTEYKLVSEWKHHGDLTRIPDEARNLTVQPVPEREGAYVTYLVPFSSVTVSNQ